MKIAWIKKIRSKRLTAIPQTKEYVNYEEIMNIALAPAVSPMERRIRAAAVFMYLTGIRVGAFVTLTIKAVDLENRFVYQYPSLGVHTKNNKSAKTVIYPISELLVVVKAWDREVRKVLPEDGFWFAPLLPDTGEINTDCREAKDTRVSLVQKNLKKWLSKNGLPIRSPHKFRHGHIHYGQAHSRTQEDYKAVSQNVMHSTTGVTDQFYSNINDEEKKNRIDSMFDNGVKKDRLSEEYKEFLQFLEWKKERNL
ncbi:MAG: tyrosine-type recombinase/integrase [Candidatus Tenebribacter davisii]|nr:tyrosine-type recombinase/integrase [Candidatus Tenebribacter davisii]